MRRKEARLPRAHDRPRARSNGRPSVGGGVWRADVCALMAHRVPLCAGDALASRATRMTEFAKKIKLQCVFASDAIDTNSFAHASKGLIGVLTNAFDQQNCWRGRRKSPLIAWRGVAAN